MTTVPHTHTGYIVGTWKLDRFHSEVSFTVKHLKISKVHGMFEKFDVTIVTAEDPRNSTAEVVIDVASVNTNQKDRDAYLRASDFFLIAQYPTMTFTSTSSPIGGHDFTVEGDLTLRGVTKPVILTGEFGGLVTDGSGQTKASATATTIINRHDYGVRWNAVFEASGITLGDDVTITLDLQVILQK